MSQSQKNLTIAEVLDVMKEHKPVCREMLYNYLRRLGIKPIGARQRPQLYPPDTAKKILTHLGFR
jgi:hypothetical protein